MPDTAKPKVLITGAAGEVGKAVATALQDTYDVIGMDEMGKSAEIPLISVDLTNDASVGRALEQFRTDHGAYIVSVIHLAGYFDFSGEDNHLYDALNVQGTRRLVEGLQRFHVEQFVFAGTMLVHKPTTPGHHIDEDQPLGPEWIYHGRSCQPPRHNRGGLVRGDDRNMSEWFCTRNVARPEGLSGSVGRRDA